jgi:proteasome lid subunit RPN8/RPN11
MSVFVPEKLRDLVNRYLEHSNRSIEHGGVFFGTESELKSFLPIPNFSDSPSDTFAWGNHRYYVREFASLIGIPAVAEMHTHPNGSIPSGVDVKDMQNGSGCPLHIVIADQKTEFRWFCFNRSLRHVQVYFNDADLEKSFVLLSESFGITDLGKVMITPKKELLCDNKLGKAFLSLDADAMSVNEWFEKNTNSWSRKKINIQKDTGLSASRVNAALKRLGREDLK